MGRIGALSGVSYKQLSSRLCTCGLCTRKPSGETEAFETLVRKESEGVWPEAPTVGKGLGLSFWGGILLSPIDGDLGSSNNPEPHSKCVCPPTLVLTETITNGPHWKKCSHCEHKQAARPLPDVPGKCLGPQSTYEISIKLLLIRRRLL